MTNNYEEMSDAQLSVKVAERSGMEVVAVAQDGAIVTGMSISFDINKPLHMWPIFLKEGITVIATERATDDGDLFEAFYVNGFLNCPDDEFHAEILFSSLDKKALRAGAICFLKMKDAEVSG
ncbi:TPA: hypothetical protein ACVU43_002994 [Vibrio parahaemolyticus]